MFANLRRHWIAFLAAPSGMRFRRQYRRRQARPHGLRTFAAVFGGILLILVGIVLLVLPGPGLLTMLIGAGLIAGESRVIARWLDRLDFRATALYARWRGARADNDAVK